MKLKAGTDGDPRYTLLRCSDGLVIRGALCPLGRLDRGHWTFSESSPEGLNSRCLCSTDSPTTQEGDRTSQRNPAAAADGPVLSCAQQVLDVA